MPSIQPNQSIIQVDGDKQPSILPTPLISKGEAEIKTFYVSSNIQMRYAITDVEAEMQNIHSEAREVIFDMTIPKEAFVSNFSMIINGTTYQATVKTKEAAKTIFANSGVTSGIIESNTQPEFIDGKQVRKNIS